MPLDLMQQALQGTSSAQLDGRACNLVATAAVLPMNHLQSSCGGGQHAFGRRDAQAVCQHSSGALVLPPRLRAAQLR
jgi:hypothetical protein